MTKIAIDSIHVGDRIRKDFGDIAELASDIAKNGLIQPIVVDQNNNLLCGERRLRACKSLGMDEVDVVMKTADDAHQALLVEIAENENRKPFSFSERMHWAQLLEPTVKANRRRGENARDVVAKEVGLGNGETYRQAKFVSQHADEEMIRQLDDDELSINAAYRTLKRRVEEQDAIIAERDETIRSYEQSEDETSEAFENLALRFKDLEDRLRVATTDTRDRDDVANNIIQQAQKDRDEAIRQRDDALEQLEKRRERSLAKSDKAASAYLELGKVVSEASGEKRERIAEILAQTMEKVRSVCV